MTASYSHGQPATLIHSTQARIAIRTIPWLRQQPGSGGLLHGIPLIPSLSRRLDRGSAAKVRTGSGGNAAAVPEGLIALVHWTESGRGAEFVSPPP